MKHIEQIDFDSPEEFLQYLDRTNVRWGGDLRCTWIFRGQGDADWALKPRAWREDGNSIPALLFERIEEAYGKHLRGRGEVSNTALHGWRIRSATEYQTVRDFADLANELGLPVPDATMIPGGLEFLKSQKSMTPDHFTPTITTCLAQHHGVPTRLLDFTRDPLVAAFFAAEQASKSPSRQLQDCSNVGSHNRTERLAVWGLDLSMLSAPDRNSIRFPHQNHQLHRAECPRSEHNFLHAQDGLFVWNSYGELHFQRTNGEWPSVEEALLDSHDNGREGPSLRKITLPVGYESTQLLQMLTRTGVSRAHLMPTYDNVTEELRMRWKWILPPLDPS